MNTSPSNADRVRAVYQAFGRQDVPAILEHLAEDVQWDYAYPDHPVPWLRAGQGRSAAGRFFQELSALEIRSFSPHTILEGPGVVVALVDFEATVRATGAPIREVNEAHVFHFDERGRVVRFRHVVDTAQHLAAWRGAGKPA